MAERVKRSAVAAPDGGWGWMIVAGCFITTICTRAVTRCVSIFFVEFHMHFSSDYSRTAWIHSLVDCITMLCAPLGSYLGNYLSCRVAVMAGGLLSSAGLIISSFATSLEYLYLSLGILTGVGFALSYTPAIAMVGTYFSERKALAFGIAMSGSGIGTFILAPVVQLLIELYSWRGALLILGGLVLHLCVCGALMRPLGTHRQKHSGKNREGEYEIDMLNSQLEEAKLHMELNLEDTKAQNENVEKAENGGSAVTVRVSSGEATKECKADGNQEQTESLLRNEKPIMTDSDQTEAKFIDPSQRDTMLEEKKCQKESANDPIVTDTDVKDNLQLMDSMLPGTADGILVNQTATCRITDSQLTDSMLAELMLAVSELNDSKPMPVDSAHTDIESKLLCEMTFCKSPGFASKNEVTKSRAKENCFCLPSIEEYSFLLIPDFLLLSVSFLFLAFGCSVPFVYLVPYSHSVGVCHQQAVLLMSILGVMGIVGNITFGWISDRRCLRAYRKVSYLLAVGLEGLGCLFVPLLRNFSLLVPFALVYGYFDGAYVALLPVVTSDTVGPTYLSSALGMVCFLHAIPYLISPPIGGWLVDQTGSYTAAFFLSGFSLICSALILAAVILVQSCKRRPSQSYIV